MLADMAFRIVSHIVNLTPMRDTLAIEVGFGTALAKRVSQVRKPVRMPSQRRSEQVVNEQIAPTKWLELMGLGDHCATAVGMNVHSPRIQVVIAIVQNVRVLPCGSGEHKVREARHFVPARTR